MPSPGLAHRDRAGRKVTRVAMRFPAHVIKPVDDACHADLGTISRNTFIIRAIHAKVAHDEQGSKVTVPGETDGEVRNFTLRLPVELNKRIEKVLKNLTYQAAKTSRNSYIVGAVEEYLSR